MIRLLVFSICSLLLCCNDSNNFKNNTSTLNKNDYIQKTIDVPPIYDLAHGSWHSLEKSSNLNFEIASGEITVKGQFDEVKVTLNTPKNQNTNPLLSFEVNVKSINTRESTRDKSLMSDLFFNQEVYPKIKFTSNDFKYLKEENKYEFDGVLSMMGKNHRCKNTF